MSSLTAPRPRVNARRQHAPLSPVNVVGRFAEGVTPDQLLQGSAILEVTDPKGVALYWCEAVLDAGRLVGVVLQKFADGDRHHVHLAGEASCTCEDASYRPDRPGGCRHVNAVKQALIDLARRTSTPDVGRATERPCSIASPAA
jgi:hypothetical protein